MQLEFWYVCPDDDGAVMSCFFPVVYVVPRGRGGSPERFPGPACGFMADLYLPVRIFSYPASKRPKAAFRITLGLHHFVDFDMLYTDGDQLVVAPLALPDPTAPFPLMGRYKAVYVP